VTSLPLTLLLGALPGCIFVAEDDAEPIAARSEIEFSASSFY
jgi:hypothetical protein